MAEETDNGLGLTEFLSNPPTEPAQAGTDVVDITPSPEPSKEEPKPEATEDKKPEEAKAEPEVKAEEKPAEKPQVDWELEDNPYKKRHLEAEERLKKTRDWASLVNQKNTEFERQLSIINKKLDGTYDAEAERREMESQVPPPHVIAQNSETIGRIAASREAAFELYGEQAVNENIFKEGSIFRQIEGNPVVRARVLSSPSPLLEAMKCVKEYQFKQKWGADPDKIESKITESLKNKIRDEVMKELKEKMLLKEEIPQGIGDARGIVSSAPSKNEGYQSLSEIIGR
jgi:hypothetical protein